MKSIRLIQSSLGLAAMCGAASASIASFQSDSASIVGSTGVSFSGSSSWTYSGGSNGLLQITLTNTTGSDVGGMLTGFAFDLGTFEGSAVLQSASVLNFVGITNVSAEPFGKGYDAGAAVGANWLGGGRPQGGLSSGQTGVFTFAVSSPSASQFSASTPFEGPRDFDFVVRFRGLNDGGSSKVVGTALTAVPAPGGAALMGAAMLFASGRRREKMI
ncbi:MAG: hypothetical protein IBJ10_08580 [Phycisphaerales bacterium]|nr:hypothetical protein [Phycisphaerales bacterium]